jgi:hypothetical protein
MASEVDFLRVWCVGRSSSQNISLDIVVDRIVVK